jgi:hypothetical protein
MKSKILQYLAKLRINVRGINKGQKEKISNENEAK